MAEKKVNCLGLDKFQMAIIKRNYNTIKPLLNKRNKAKEKLDETIRKATEKYNEEVGMADMQIETFDKITKDCTKVFCGYELTSEQAVLFNDNPEKFDEFKQKNPLETEMDFNDEEQPRDLHAEEDKKWEERINSGELKEVTYHENIGEGHDDGLGE
jgi:hypothetical protein